MHSGNQIGFLVLAAGESSRMGTPKQLLPWGDTTLLSHVISEVRNSGIEKVMIVLGGNSGEIVPYLKHDCDDVIINENWKDGLGNSISFGVHSLLKKYPELTGIGVALGDQPLVSSAYFTELLRVFLNSGAGLAASEYDHTLGVPAIFGKQYFNDLKLLRGSSGAKRLIATHRNEGVFLSAEDIKSDIDTPAQYRDLYLKKFNSLP